MESGILFIERSVDSYEEGTLNQSYGFRQVQSLRRANG